MCYCVGLLIAATEKKLPIAATAQNWLLNVATVQELLLVIDTVQDAAYCCCCAEVVVVC